MRIFSILLIMGGLLQAQVRMNPWTGKPDFMPPRCSVEGHVATWSTATSQYVCAAPPGSTLAAGPSGLVVVDTTGDPDTVDVNTGPGQLAVKNAANEWTGVNDFTSGRLIAPTSTFASLPAAATVTGQVFVVTDAASAGSCAAGSGTDLALCRSNGTTYVALGDGGGGTIASTTSVLKGDNAGNAVAATAGTDYVTPSSTETLTNKTLDAEGTGNSLTTVEKHVFNLASCTGASAIVNDASLPSTNAASPVCIGTAGAAALAFPDAVTSTAQMFWELPSDWTATGGLGVKIVITGDTASTSTIRWNFAVGCMSNNQPLDTVSFNAGTQSNSPGPAVVGWRQVVGISSLTVTNCSASETLAISLQREGGHATGDVYAGVAQVLQLELTYRRAQ